MNHHVVCCLQTSNSCCICVNFEFPACWLVQFCPLGLSMNCSFIYLVQHFFFFVLVSAENYKSKDIPYGRSDSSCTLPWVQIYEGCYLFSNYSNQSRTWEQSKKYCSNRNGHLVEIGSRQKQLSLAGET